MAGSHIVVLNIVRPENCFNRFILLIRICCDLFWAPGKDLVQLEPSYLFYDRYFTK